VSAQPELSLVFPAFNEEGNLRELLASALDLGSKLGRSFEIVVVDDGSRDRSAALLRRFRRAHREIRVVRHPANRGYGAALRSGLRAARGELVFFSDADLQFDLAELERLLDHAAHPGRPDGLDVVAGYRAPRRDGLGRRLLAFGWGRLVGALFGVPVRDIDCAFKVFRREVLEDLPIASIGAFVNTEILVRAQAAGFRIGEVPVSHRPRRHGRATGARPKVIARALLELATLWGELRALPAADAAASAAGPPRSRRPAAS
jgi:glycosyltransferase involved in cell wall biosynthesis